jgi:transposase
MSGRTRVRSTGEQLTALQELARSDRRDEADRARAVVLSINGWTSGQIARAFGVTPDSVRRWRGWFAQDGVEGLRAGEHRGREPVKSSAAAVVVGSLLSDPVADRANWTLPRLQAEIARQADTPIWLMPGPGVAPTCGCRRRDNRASWRCSACSTMPPAS